MALVRIKTRVLYILFSLLIVFCPPYAWAANQCLLLFSESGTRASTESSLPKYQSAAFDVIEARSGKHGGQRLVIRRKGPWFDFKSELAENIGDLVPDLRMNIFLLGAKEAEFFGFELLDDFTLTVPDVTELNGAIAKFNSSLPEGDPRRIVITTYAIPNVTNSMNEYLGNFVEGGRFPISQKGKGFFHDISAHALEGFAVDNRLVEVIRTRTYLANKLLKVLRQDMEGKSLLPLFKKIASNLKTSFVGMVDQIGAFNPLFMDPEFRIVLGEIGTQQYQTIMSNPELKNLLPGELEEYVKQNGAISSFGTEKFWAAGTDDFQQYLQKRIVEEIRIYAEKEAWRAARSLTEDEITQLENLTQKINLFWKENAALDKGNFDFDRLANEVHAIEKWRQERPLIESFRQLALKIKQKVVRTDISSLSTWEQRLQTMSIAKAYTARLQHLRRLITEP